MCFQGRSKHSTKQSCNSLSAIQLKFSGNCTEQTCLSFQSVRWHFPSCTKYSTDQVVLQKSSPAGGAIFFAHRGLSQTSAQASSATANLPTANPPRSHRRTTQLPVEIAEGSISIAAGAYRTAGDVSMIDSLKIFRIHVSYFPSGMYERQIL